MLNLRKRCAKGQGALEYLLLIGGALIIAVIVTVLLISTSASSKVATEGKVTAATNMTSNVAIPAALNSVVCADNTCTVFFMDFGGTHQLVIDDVNSADVIDKIATCSSPITVGKHKAHIITTNGTSVTISNTIYFDVGSSGGAPIETVATPTANPAGGPYHTDPIVTLSTTTSGAHICYRLSFDPSCSDDACVAGTLYTAPFTITHLPSTLKAIGCKIGLTQSEILTEVYTSNSVTPGEIIPIDPHP